MNNHIFIVAIDAAEDSISENRDGIYHLVAHPFSVSLLPRPMSPKYAFGEHMLSARTHIILKAE